MEQGLALVMLGDVMLGRIVDAALALPGSQEAIWGDFLPILRGGAALDQKEDWLVTGNLECAVTREEEEAPNKVFHFKLHPDHIGALRSACVAFVSLANNHSLDFGRPGLRETMRVLDQQGITYAGVGLADQAGHPAFVSRAGMKLAFFSYSDHPEEWSATRKRMGINYINPQDFDPGLIRTQLGLARAEEADMVVVFIHWGPNWQWLPSRAIQQLGHAFIDYGADIVFGHSSHHVQGIEVYQHKPIIYGAGGWVDDYRLHEDFRNDLGFLYCCHIMGGTPQHLELIPSKINHNWLATGASPPYLSTVSLAQGDDRRWMERTLRKLCGNFGTKVEPSPRGLVIPLARDGTASES